MLSKKEHGIVLNIVKHCHRIISKIDGVTLESFRKDEDLEEIICFNLLQIGELAKGLPDDFFKKYPKMPWKQIKGMRDKVAHGYGTLEFDLVYATAKEDVSALHDYCLEIVKVNEIK